ncbi:ATP-binding protein [Streptococcus mitis]|jgi:ATP-binding region, ATPase family protein|uniref:Uncharacterized protein n=1 Tax=Streptococcus mitis TaxID=28037 RepID=A0A1X1L1G8_STRMT|nr:ATP-binding protein [Streptococcus mitis]ORP05409.1 hypothetical protein B7694_05620 [Streptococcus mitis]HET0949604.1 sensor histidine kinase [Streptococcus pneumoniae]
MEHYIHIPRSLNFEFRNISKFYSQYSDINEVLEKNDVIRLNFSNTNFISGEMTVLLSMVVESLHNRDYDVQANYKSLPQSTQNLLSRNGFFKRYKLAPGLSDNKNTVIQLSKIPCKDEDAVDEYIENKFLAKIESEIEPIFRNEISIFIFELVHNILEHSGADNVIMCGQHYPNMNKIRFAIADTGIGLPNYILSKKSLSSEKEAIKWAFTKGNTTKELESDTDSGVGLAYIQEKISKKASMKLFSNHSYFHIKQDGSLSYRNLEYSVHGTLIIFDFDIEQCNKML